MSRPLAANWDLTAERAAVRVRLVFIEGWLVRPLGVPSAHGKLRSVCLWLAARYLLAQKLPSAPMKRSTVCALFPVSELIWLYPQITPSLVLLAVQNNFLGWLYAIRCQSKLQPWVEMARKQPEKQRGEQTRTIASAVTEWTEANSSNSFLQKPFNEADNIPFLCVNAQES